MLNAEQIAAAQEPPAGKVEVPEWGGQVGVRYLGGTEVANLSALVAGDGRDNIETLARFLALVLCDDAGRRLFVDDDWPKLAARGFEVLLRVAREAQRLNGLGKEAREELRKN